MDSRKRSDDCQQNDIPRKFRRSSDEDNNHHEFNGNVNLSSSYTEANCDSSFHEPISVSTQTSAFPSRIPFDTEKSVNEDPSTDMSSVKFRLGSLEDKVQWLGREMQFIRELLQCITKLLPYKCDHAPSDFASFDRQFTSGEDHRRLSNDSGRDFLSSARAEAMSISNKDMEERFGSIERGSSRLSASTSGQKRPYGYAIKYNPAESRRSADAHSATHSSFKESSSNRDVTFNRRGHIGELLNVATESFANSLTPGGYNEQNEATAAERRKKDKLFAGFLPVDGISALDIIYLWEHGTEDWPPIGVWAPEQKAAHMDQLFQWEKIYKIFKNDCHADIRTFQAKYSDERGDILPIYAIIAKSQNQFDSNPPELNRTYPLDIDARKLATGAPNLERMIESLSRSSSSNQLPYFPLPRKISGRKVSAKDVIHMWDYGFGEMTPIKNWTPAQKLKQQSKISRWKKVVDIFKVECGGDMKKFEEKYSNESGTLLPVAAIITKYESMQVTPVDVLSRPPTMSYLGDSSSWLEDQTARMSNSDDASSDEDNNKSGKGHRQFMRQSSSMSNSINSYKPDEFSTSYGPVLGGNVSSAFSSFSRKISSIPRSSDTIKLPRLLSPLRTKRTFTDYASHPSWSATLTQGRSSLRSKQNSRMESRNEENDLEIKGGPLPPQNTCFSEVPASPYLSWQSSNDREKVDLNAETRFAQAYPKAKEQLYSSTNVIAKPRLENEVTSPTNSFSSDKSGKIKDSRDVFNGDKPSSSSGQEDQQIESSLDDDYSHFILPRKINGRKVSAKDVIQMWYHGFNTTPPIGSWTPPRKIKQQSKISRWKKIVDIFVQECQGDLEHFGKKFSNKLGELLPIAAIIAKYDSDKMDDNCSLKIKADM